MYRDGSWVKGHYIDNHKKYECLNCGKQFIIGEVLEKDCPPGFPVCPYCGQSNVECVTWTEDDRLQNLEAEMGCLAICIDFC